jgi:UDP-2,3-diacylglucosamine pyrophosphatase LpxH
MLTISRGPVLRIQILSDLHHEGRDKLDVPDVDADVVVLAGDIDEGTAGVQWALDTFTVPVVYVLGNHEPYAPAPLSELEREIRRMTDGTHVHLLQNSVKVIHGVRFLGGTLWADYAVTGNQADVIALAAGKSDFRKIRIEDPEEAFTPQALIALHAEARRFLETELASPFPGKTVVVTHFGSSPQSLLPKHMNYPTRGTYSSDMEDLMGDNVALWAHGHIHDSLDFAVKGTRVVCNPRGGLGVNSFNPDFNPHMVVEL